MMGENERSGAERMERGRDERVGGRREALKARGADATAGALAPGCENAGHECEAYPSRKWGEAAGRALGDR